jgi:hypothetical protein
MASHFTLTFEDEDGRRRAVAVDTPRFRVGRGEENDLRLGIAGLSRRHALLELIGDSLYLSDTGSSNGTTVNGQPVVDAVEVCDGDVIALGDACTLRVSNEVSDAYDAPVAPAAEAPNVPVPAPAVEAPAAKPSAFGPHVIVGGLVGLALLACVVLLALYFGGAGRSAAADDGLLVEEEEAGNLNSGAKAGAKSNEGAAVKTADARVATSLEPTSTPSQPSLTTQPSVNVQPSLTTPPADAAAVRGKAGGEPDRDAVRRVMARVSNDDSPYISDEGARDVARKVKEYGGSGALAGRMRAMARGCAEVTALARANNLRPALLTYAALAEAEATGSDPVEAARRMAPKLLTLRATFGTETANSALLLVAAYPYPFDPVEGERTRRPHPLAARLVKLGGEHPEVAASVARSVWFLREQNGLSTEAYELVVRLLAVGVIAQRPGEYGVEAPPLMC